MSHQTPSVSALSEFFKGSEAKFGIFYPTGYLMAAFPDFAAAQHAARNLEFSGFSRDEVLAVPGEEMVLLAEEERGKVGLWGLMIQEISRLIATEEVYTDHDLKLARAGAAFVVVHCPTDKGKRQAWEIIQPFDPMVARHYALDGIEHFKGEL
jgi:hypothetical protein